MTAGELTEADIRRLIVTSILVGVALSALVAVVVRYLRK